MTITLTGEEPFARGGNRLCYVDPRDAHRCIKVRRPDFTLADLRRKKGFPHTLKPLWMLDESHHEHELMQSIHQRLGERAYRVLARNYGFVETDLGRGLCSELIRDADGRIAWSVMQIVWDQGVGDDLVKAIDAFEQDWAELLIPSRDLLLHNLVAPRDASGRVQRLVLIDGLGYSGVIPFALLPAAYKRQRARRKMDKFRQALNNVVERRDSGYRSSRFWQQHHDGLTSLEQKEQQQEQGES